MGFHTNILFRICRSASAACAGSLSNWATADSMSWATSLLGCHSWAHHLAGGSGLGVAGGLGRDVAVGDAYCALLLGGFAKFT